MIETTTATEVEVRLSPAEIALVRTALKLLLSILGHDQADELAAVKALLREASGCVAGAGRGPDTDEAGAVGPAMLRPGSRPDANQIVSSRCACCR